MEVSINIKLRPFTVPNYVLVEQKAHPKQDGFSPDGLKYHLSDLDSITLDRLCDEFRAAVFKKANRGIPPTVG